MKKRILFFGAFVAVICSYAQEKNCATPSDFGTTYVTKGGSVRIPVTINNTGSNIIKSIGYVITRDGVESGQKSASTGNIAVGESGQVNIVFQADSEARKSRQTITITKVNSTANTSEEKSATGSIVTILEKPKVVPVVEEFTGTWCGWCPIGFDGMERAHETFGDKAALIAIHYSDPMQVSDFSDIVGRASSFPSALIGRGAESFYPSASELKKQINQEIQNKVAPASMQVSAEWTSATQRIIKIVTKTKFVYSDDNANLAIAYALTEDGMTGTESNWAQSNYLSGNSNYASSLPFWYKASSNVFVEFNHVGVAAWEIANGIDGSVNPVVQAGDVQEYTYKANIGSNTLIQDKSRLKVIAMLIDRDSGTIVNAAQTTITDYATGVQGLTTDGNTTSHHGGEIYDLNGRRVGNGQLKMDNGQLKPGIYIVNGKKVMVK
ncbi:MAG: Omp28-related outer membrane protein [Bacteroidaceae bacterium]|nr:Omp28-related outer membrane protein [Bacteroidaceae bacterium]